jgi:hypothetical protein
LTQQDYYSYLLHYRTQGVKILHLAGRLFQEFIVDAYAQIEQNRLRYLRLNQTQLRADLYQGLADAVADGSALSDIGARTVLPSSFTGGPRQMRQLYYDAMAIVRSCTKPDLFITMTCNPRWDEIISNLEPGQSAQDRPDLTARVFQMKLALLLHDLIDLGVLGDVLAHMHVIEFQKRGLPHAHILLILLPSHKPHTPEQIDSIVSAQLPDRTAFPQLHETIVSCMLHGPCGSFNVNAPCMIDGKCSKHYPKAFGSETKITADKYPEYKRPDNGAFVSKGGFDYTNRDVIPYNPYLSVKYNCHINVEIANGILAVKYLYKYVYKGHDRTCVTVEMEHRNTPVPIDEIKEYLDSRYVSACEASWRIFSFRLHHHYPPVQRLQLHLPDLQSVVFDPQAQTAEELLRQSNIRKTTLTAFFDACREFPDLTVDLLYPDFPSKFTWKNTERVWRPRKLGQSIGRVYFAVPSDGERYWQLRCSI